ncbi:D-TA family PLP-dependent enzyme [Candidatus Thorarchaeota archaeon]|nr:MAG: D-TA family PLP-dependent enzyme [Candidatus Thorarchaeota archaeon]
MLIDELQTPALLLDRNRLHSNITRMAKKAEANDVRLRPHIKTHKCIEVANLQRSEGASSITVSTVWEAAAFATSGFDDITLAVPMVRDKVEYVVRLAKSITMNVLVDSASHVEWLDRETTHREAEIGVLIKVDCGYHRCGVDPDSEYLVELAQKIDTAKWLDFRGILTHAGHAYDATSVEQIRSVAQQEQNVMARVTKRLADNGLGPEVVSIGSTPTMSLAPAIRDEITEIRPGNYVFYDYDQVGLGSCSYTDCALTVLASVIGNYGDRLVIDAGATALSKDLGPVHVDAKNGYGRVFLDGDIVEPTGDRVVSVSQEHGKIRLEPESPLREARPRDCIRILPNHSCLTANLFDSYAVYSGETIVDSWKILRQRDRGIFATNA